MLITHVEFRCCGCGTKWAIQLDRALHDTKDMLKFLKTSITGCPQECGATKCDVAFKLDKEKCSCPKNHAGFVDQHLKSCPEFFPGGLVK